MEIYMVMHEMDTSMHPAIRKDILRGHTRQGAGEVEWSELQLHVRPFINTAWDTDRQQEHHIWHELKYCNKLIK
eukprot:14691550-Heterocapsa_arctica.AAC.1